MRYPEDLFKVQRNMLAAYHVTDAKTFYEGNDQWKVPEDPENKPNKQPPYRLSVRDALRRPEPGVLADQRVYVPQKRQNLASFISVDADAAHERLRQDPDPAAAEQHPGAGPVADREPVRQRPARSSDKLLRVHPDQRQGDLRQPADAAGRRRPALRAAALHAARDRAGHLPALRFVLVSFGDAVGVGTTLNAALDDVLGTTVKDNVSNGTGGSASGGGGAVSSDVRALLQQAESKFAAAQKSLEAGDLQGYAKAQGEARAPGAAGDHGR